MVDVIISFDSEDLLTPAAADAERWWAEALRERGIRGSFQLVADMVRGLKRQGRDDVIHAIRQHEIGFHSDRHSLPPSHPVAVENLSLDEGTAHVIRSEASGLAEVASTFSTWPVSYCSPGDSWTPATLVAMARMGIRVFCNDRLAHATRQPYWYLGMLIASYDLDFQNFYEHPQLDFVSHFEHLRAATPDDGLIVLYTHPTRLVTSAFWDVPFYAGRNPPLAECPPAPLRPADEVHLYQDRCRSMLDWLVRHPDIRLIDFATLYGERAGSRRSIDHLLVEEHLRSDQEGRLPLRHSPESAFLSSAARLDIMRYEWPLYPPGFTGRRLIEQAAALAWTAAPAPRNATRRSNCDVFATSDRS